MKILKIILKHLSLILFIITIWNILQFMGNIYTDISLEIRIIEVSTYYKDLLTAGITFLIFIGIKVTEMVIILIEFFKKHRKYKNFYNKNNKADE